MEPLPRRVDRWWRGGSLGWSCSPRRQDTNLGAHAAPSPYTSLVLTGDECGFDQEVETLRASLAANGWRILAEAITRSALCKAGPQAPNPKPQTPNPKPHTPQTKPQTPNPKPHTPHSKPQTPNTTPHTPHPKFHTPNPEPETPNPKPQTPNAKRQTPNGKAARWGGCTSRSQQNTTRHTPLSRKKLSFSAPASRSLLLLLLDYSRPRVE